MTETPKFRRAYSQQELDIHLNTSHCFAITYSHERPYRELERLYAIIDAAVEMADLASIASDASNSATTLQAIQNRAREFLEIIK